MLNTLLLLENEQAGQLLAVFTFHMYIEGLVHPFI